MRLEHVGSVLRDEQKNHFHGLVPTAFLLCSPDRPWSFICDYIDEMKGRGASGFRALWNCYWGPSGSGSHGGSTEYWSNRERLITRTEDVLKYLKLRNMYLFLELLDPSIEIAIGDRYYAAGDSGWTDLAGQAARLSIFHDNCILGTGNEPAKGKQYERVLGFQTWLVERLRLNHQQAIIAAEINQGTGCPELETHPDVDVIGYKTPRWDAESVVRGTYDEVRIVRCRNPGKVMWLHEPPRRNYPTIGSWCSDTHRRWLREIMFASLGSVYTPHGLGHGQEEHQPEDWGGDGQFLWGIGRQDWPEDWNAYRLATAKIRTPPAGPDARTRFDLIPDSSWYGGDAMGFSTADHEHYLAVAKEDVTWVNLPQVTPCYWRLINLQTGVVEWSEYRQEAVFSTTSAAGCLIYVRQTVEDEPQPA